MFGNGERTGNLDIANVALNMNSHGIETGLDFSDLPSIRAVYERVTRMSVASVIPMRASWSSLPFPDLIRMPSRKALDLRKEELKKDSDTPWAVPYLTIDPQDIGRSYEAIIRINSQSGKGGVAYVLDREHGFDLPKTMHPTVGMLVYALADELGRELTPDEIRERVFREVCQSLTSPWPCLTMSLITMLEKR